MIKIFNTPQIKDIRRELRKQPIACERLLWNKLRNRQIGGYKFKRQVSIDRFVVDFYCHEAKLIVEIDGATHCSIDELDRDIIRQVFLESQGSCVKRYTNTEIKENLSLVLENILKICRTNVYK